MSGNRSYGELARVHHVGEITPVMLLCDASEVVGGDVFSKSILANILDIIPLCRQYFEASGPHGRRTRNPLRSFATWRDGMERLASRHVGLPPSEYSVAGYRSRLGESDLTTSSSSLVIGMQPIAFSLDFAKSTCGRRSPYTLDNDIDHYNWLLESQMTMVLKTWIYERINQ